MLSTSAEIVSVSPDAETMGLMACGVLCNLRRKYRRWIFLSSGLFLSASCSSFVISFDLTIVSNGRLILEVSKMV